MSTSTLERWQHGLPRHRDLRCGGAWQTSLGRHARTLSPANPVALGPVAAANAARVRAAAEAFTLTDALDCGNPVRKMTNNVVIAAAHIDCCAGLGGRDDVFGPVLAVSNDLEYGLTASIRTRDLNRAHRTAARIEAGHVWIHQTSAISPAPISAATRNQAGAWKRAARKCSPVRRSRTCTSTRPDPSPIEVEDAA